MKKVIGAKVSEGVYDRISELGLISTILRRAVDEYLDRHDNTNK